MQEIYLNSEEKDFRTAEAYKMLRTNLEFSGEEIKVVAITSAMPNEGKSTVSFNLAEAFAMSGKRVLLIDADLRKSVLQTKVKNGRPRFGLTHYLTGQNTLDEVLCKTDIDNLYLCLAGPVPANPSELLGGKRFATLIEAAKKAFDFIIVDTPFVGSVADALVVAQRCDGVVVVVRSGITSRRFAKKAQESLKLTNCKILGCVLNDVHIGKKNSYYEKYYDGYCESYYESEDSDDSDSEDDFN